jgi:hypothetical protein
MIDGGAFWLYHVLATFCDLRRLVTDTCGEGSFGAATLAKLESTFGSGTFTSS